jgi:hypothetical protein
MTSSFRVFFLFTRIRKYRAIRHCIYLWLYRPLDFCRFFSFLIHTQPARGPFGRGISTSQGHCLHRTTQSRNKRTQTSMPRVGFEPTIQVFERAKTVHGLIRTATMIFIGYYITGVTEEVSLNIPRLIHFVEGLKITTQSTSAGIRICYFRYGSYVRYRAFYIYEGVVL